MAMFWDLVNATLSGTPASVISAISRSTSAM